MIKSNGKKTSYFYAEVKLTKNREGMYLIILFGMKAEALEAHSKLLEIQSRLNKFAYLSKQALPGAADALIYQKLKDCQKMPTKEKYFNFHHWYNTMCQFAGKEIDKWIQNKTKVEDKLILDSLSLLNTIKPTLPKDRDTMMNYVMNIFLKEEIENSFENTQSKLLSINPLKIGEELNMSFKPPQGRSNENLNEIWISFKMSPAGCQILKDIVSNWAEVKNIQIKKIMKEKRN